jgi:hypothetical protein
MIREPLLGGEIFLNLSRIPKAMNMLENLFHSLGAYSNIAYAPHAAMVSKRGKDIEVLSPVELIALERSTPKESLFVVYHAIGHSEGSLRMMFLGEDSAAMLATVKELRLPRSWPSNMGERAFYNFQQALNHVPRGPVQLEQMLPQGSEWHLSLILRKLARVYSGGKIDLDFYHTPGQALAHR